MVSIMVDKTHGAQEMPSILGRIMAKKRERLESAKASVPLTELKAKIRSLPPADFRHAIGRRESINVIAEFKQSSPSRGIIRPDFSIAEIHKSYEEGGAAAYSVLTEEDFFDGSLENLRKVRTLTKKPILRKDFIFDSYQIFESYEAGADAVLLIAAALEVNLLRDLTHLARELGMAALTEVHSREELDSALAADADIIGINNRNLHTFEVDLRTSLTLCDLVPQKLIRVSESGIRSNEDIVRLRAAGIDAFLIGEYLLRAEDIAEKLMELRGVRP